MNAALPVTETAMPTGLGLSLTTTPTSLHQAFTSACGVFLSVIEATQS